VTFTEIQDRIAERLNIPSSATQSLARIGRLINDVYREVTTSVGIELSRRSVAVTGTTSLGIATVTFTGVEKLERVYDDTSGTTKILTHVTFDQMCQINPAASDTVRRWVEESWDGNSVTIRIDALPQTVFNLKADGYRVVTSLNGSDVPEFPPSFHDILIEGVLAEEYLKMEKMGLADRAQSKFEKRLSDLRLWNAKNIGQINRQGETRLSPFGGTATGNGGGGGAPNGGTSYVQTGKITFDRDPESPFDVTSGSAMVANLDAERLGGMTAAELIASIDAVDGPASATDHAIARFDGTTGNTIQNSGITIPDGASGTLTGTNSGDVTLAGSFNYLSITGQIITLAAIDLASHVTGRLPYANFVAATTGSKVVGIRSGAGGNYEECSLGAGLTMSNGGVLDTSANATAQSPNTIYAGPASGGAATPSFRTQVVADLPTSGEWTGENVQVSAGGGTEQFKLSGVMDFDDTQSTTPDNNLLIFRQYTIPGSTLDSNGRMVVFRGWGTLAADGDSKGVYAYLDTTASTQIAQLTASSSTFTMWSIEIRIIRIASNSQRIYTRVEFSAPFGNGAGPHVTQNVVTASKTDTSPIVIMLAGLGTNASDIVYEASIVEMWN
jgi:hypothetical protein